MKHTLSTYAELDIEVRGTYHKARRGDYWNPPEPAHVDDFGVFLDGNEITHLLTDKQTQDLIDRFIESAEDNSYDDLMREIL
jgi:hypothetical protein